jgi:hypothetical protein
MRHIPSFRAVSMACGVLAALAGGPARADGPVHIDSLRFLGATTLPNDLQVDHTLVGGLSGIDYDPEAHRWVMISDDKSEYAPARFYLGRIDFDLQQGVPKVTLDRAVILLRPDGKPYPNDTEGSEVPDAEAVRVDPAGRELLWTSEGDRKLGLSPFLRESGIDGAYRGEVRLPAMFQIRKDREFGPRPNHSSEGLSFTPSHAALWLGMETALYQDGPVATTEAGTVARFTKFDRQGHVLGQYAYTLDPIPHKPAGKHSDNGVSEILALDDNRLLVMERSAVEGADNHWTVYIRLYEADAAGATDVSTLPALAGARYRPMKKRLILDLSKLSELGSAALPFIDNVEGASFGPTLSDGHRSLVLVSDNNFNPEQITQFLAFEILP